MQCPLINAIRLILATLFAGQMLCAQNREVLGEYKIGIVGQDNEDTIYQATHLGARNVARELSEQYSIDIELVVLTPDSSQGGSQQTSIEQLFIEDADGFIISPGLDANVRKAVEFALEQEQEIVFFETALKGIQPLASIIADEYQAGKLAGEAMLKLLPVKGRAAILINENPSPALQARLNGIRASMGYKRIETIVHCKPDYFDANKKITDTEREDHNDLIKGWVFLDDWPLLGLPTLPWEPGKVPCVVIQSSPSAFLYIDQGYVNSLIVHPYYDWGQMSVEALVNKLHKETAPEQSVVKTQPRVIDFRNVEDYRKSWKNWLQ